MARRSRHHFSNGFYHVILRGNAGEDIFFTDHDRNKMSFLIQEGIERFGHKVVAYCFMSNHIHLAIQVGNIPLSQIIQNVAFRYTRYINTQKNRVGHLFQGRYKGILLNGEAYLKALVRYIHLNPVRAGIVSVPEAYKWSSHNAYLGREGGEWVSQDYVLSLFGNSKKEAVKRYQMFVEVGMGIEEEAFFETGLQGGVVADEQFIATLEDTPKDLRPSKAQPLTSQDVIGQVCDFYGIQESVLRHPGKSRRIARIRAMLGYLAREKGWITLEKLAGLVQRDASALSHGVTSLTKKEGKSSEFKNELAKLHQHIARISGSQA